jgi:hypothetical protein
LFKNLWLKRFLSLFQSTTLSRPQSWVGAFDRPEAFHPIDHHAKCEAHIAHLNMVLRLLRSREKARG